MISRRIAALLLAAVLLVGVALIGYSTYNVTLSKPIATSRVGDTGSSATQVKQREFDEHLEKVNARIESVYQCGRRWDSAKDWMFWPALVITVLLTILAPFAGGNTNTPTESGSTVKPREGRIACVIMVLASISGGLQIAEKGFEAQSKKQNETVRRLNDAAKKARIAFADAKNDKEYQQAIDMLRDAELDIK